MKFETAKGVVPKQRVAGNMFGREDAIRTMKCIAVIGCEREISEEEYYRWDTPTKAEYSQSGWCIDCQNNFFGINEDCTCRYVDVGLSVNMPDPMNAYCPEHGDPDLIDGPDFDYDPDMREDEPPHDIAAIKWPAEVL